ncbi:MAG TPA: DegT/DnrJ/EryC1/StrS family aminotransferase [Planctomycetota bacterium]|nr:DegT/DnrJ/EryC1/StrS family aminotransferase [Planctomycetota bacterium]
MKVPLSKVYTDQELKDRVCKVIDSGTFILGPECKAFEAELAQWLGKKHVVLISNATSAAQLCFTALGIGAGDEVMTVAHTAFPTIEAIFGCGATPVFIDVDDTYCMDPAWLESRITRRTKAINPVHLYGHPCDMDAIQAVAKKHGLLVVEDCAQAHGAKYKGKTVGTMGVAGTFSFYPSKNLPVLGDGGAVATDDAALAQKIRMLRDHGRSDKYTHQIAGYNMRFNEIQAATGRWFLSRLEKSNDRRREAAAMYTKRLSAIPGLKCPTEKEWARAVYHLYVIRVKDRDALAKKLEAKGIGTGVHYPLPNHLQPGTVNDRRVRAEALPATESASKEILSLPIFPTITDQEVEYVCDAVAEHYGALATSKA